VQTCLILAGGLGTRLRGVLHDRPKCLAPVGDRTFLDIQMERLAEAGVTEILLSLGHGAQLVIEWLEGNPAPVPVRYEVERDPLGTGGAIARALEVFGLEETLVANGDTYLDGDLATMFLPLDRQRQELFRMATVSVPDRHRFGGVESDAAGRVERFLEKGRHDSGPINAGLYRLCDAAIPKGSTGAFSLEHDVLPSLVNARTVTLAAVNGTFIDIGVPADYERFRAEYAS
jgi:D-glycero-alpha-D-manno-heptose 1-phosphate guanylyltransferase